MNGDSTSPNYAEYSVIQAPTKKSKLMKLAIVIVAAIIFLTIFAILANIALPMLGVMPIVLVVIVYIAFLFWKFTNIEYDYTISGGELKMCTVYSGRNRSTLFEARISNADAIVAYNGNIPPEAEGADKEYNCVSSMNAQGIVCMVFKDDSGKKCAAYFETNKKILGLLKFYNSRAYKVV